MKLTDVIKEIQEDNMSKDRLESYHAKLSSYLSELSLFRATLEKEEALFMGHEQNAQDKPSVAQSKVNWKASSSGQKLLGVKGEIEAVKPLISSVKSRLYNFL
jgi:hypothetical protein